MTNRKEMYARIFKWCADVGHCPLESDINELIGFFENEKSGSSPFCQRETDIPEFGGSARQVAAGQVGGVWTNEGKMANWGHTKADAPADLDEIKRELDLKIYEYLLEVERSESIDFSAVNQFWRRQGALLGMRIAVNHLASTGRLSGVTNEGERG